MARVSTPLGLSSPDGLSLFSITTSLLSNSPILVFFGPSSTANATHSSWRIQAHIFTLAGFRSFPRITTSPNSPLYAAVKYLPPEHQGDEVRRGLAISLLRYFEEVPDVVKDALVQSASFVQGVGSSHSSIQFGEAYAGSLASKLVKVENTAEVLRDLQAAFTTRTLSNIDIDVVLPSDFSTDAAGQSDPTLDEDDPDSRYGPYASLIKLFGAPTFLPTSKLRRAPSRPLSRNRSKSLSVEQEASIRREIDEFVETEDRYVAKLEDLVNNVAREFRHKARQDPLAGTGPDERAVEELFPASLDEILNVNSVFWKALIANVRMVQDGEGVDSKSSTDEHSMSTIKKNGSDTKDVILEFSKMLIDWFPQFADCYGRYIRSSGAFSQLLSRYLKDPGSGFSQRVREIGEQKLRAMLIEPVQRLPRYSLFIDNIVNLLPLKHPAMQYLLQARDIVADICALQSSGAEESQPVDRLSKLVASWPSTLRPHGRLITAVDYLEVPAPYRLDLLNKEQKRSILLLFSDYLISVKRAHESSLTARGVIAEVDRPSRDTLTASMAVAATGQRTGPPLVFDECFLLRDVSVSEAGEGSLIFMTSKGDAQTKNAAAQKTQYPPHKPTPSLRAFYFFGSYEGRVSRWTEDIAKARIEGRFSEQEREIDKWELRTIKLPEESLTLFSTISLGSVAEAHISPRSSDSIRLAVSKPGSDGNAERMGNAAIAVDFDGNAYRLRTCLPDEPVTMNQVNPADFSRTLGKILGELVRSQNHPRDSASTASHLSRNLHILRSLTIQMERDQIRFRTFKAPSPVKLLSSFLGGGGTIRDPVDVQQIFPKLGDIAPILTPTRKTSGDGNKKWDIDAERPKTATVFSSRASNVHGQSFEQLEEVLLSYIVALSERRGDIIGSILRGRHGADDHQVDEVYNTILDDASKRPVLAEVPVQILFVAFEKFLKLAWQSQMGPVVSIDLWDSLQDRAGTLLPTAFENHFKVMIGDMSPQNRRSFKAIIKLLADLLEASGNDGDRGALTAAFTELLVPEGDPHVYISLLDRLVEDFELFFEDSKEDVIITSDSPSKEGSINSMKRMRSFNTGSISSNASSLRKRFGFPTLSRENSKIESNESKVGSVWRTLSKTARGAVTGGDGSTISSNTNSKVSLARSKSTDIIHRTMLPPQRPGSRDLPTVLGAFNTSLEDTPSRPQTSSRPLEYTPDRNVETSPIRTTAGSMARRKRRSSLSDLKTLQESPGIVPSFSPLPRRTPDGSGLQNTSVNTTPRTPSPVKMATVNQLQRSINRKENNNSPMTPGGARGTLMERPMNIQSEEAPSSVKRSGNQQYHRSPSGIPVLKGLTSPTSPSRQRCGSTLTTTAGSPTRKPTSSPQKLRIPSPQKLRTHLQTERQTITNTDSDLQTELFKIGQELRSIRRTPTSIPNISTLSNRLNDLTHKQQASTKEIHTRLDTLQKHIDILEEKNTSIEELYKEAAAENEILYERFNDELAKISTAVRHADSGVVVGGNGKGPKGEEGVKALTEKLRETQAELGKLKKENIRFKRELVGLRAIAAGR